MFHMDGKIFLLYVDVEILSMYIVVLRTNLYVCIFSCAGTAAALEVTISLFWL